MDSIGCNCSKKNEDESDSRDEKDDKNNVKNKPKVLPKTVVDVKIDTKNFIRQRTEKFDEEYIKVKELGSGAFGSVFLVKQKFGGEIRAMKEISKTSLLDSEDPNTIKNEFNVLRKLDHPNVMKIYEIFEDKENIYLINEYCNGGDLAEKMDKYGVFCEFLLKYIMYQVFIAVNFLHVKNVLHGDLKRENILAVYINEKKEGEDIFQKLRDSKKIQTELMKASTPEQLSSRAMSYLRELVNIDFKLVDFGSAKMKKKGERKKLMSGITGTAYYCSPEVIENKYNFECDEWACGIMMFILLTGFPPFDGEDEEEVFNNIMKGKLNLDIKELKHISKPCKNLINKLLNKDKKKRITAAEALKEDFFTKGIDIGKLLKGEGRINDEMLLNYAKRKTMKEGKRSLFREAVIAYIALNFADKDEERRIKEVFREISGGNDDFIITKDTFIDKMSKITKGYTPKQLSDLFDEMDENRNESIEFQELIRALSDEGKLLSEKNLREAFKFFDIDGNGEISWNEIADIVFKGKTMNKNITTEFLEEIGEKDLNVKIGFEQFSNVILKRNNKPEDSGAKEKN